MFRKPLQYSISTLLLATFLVAVGITVSGKTWLLVGFIEILFFVVVLFVLGVNFPSHIEHHVIANAIRADGSHSPRRAKIEHFERRRFIANVAILLLVFIAASNLLLLTLRVDRIFEGQTYIVNSPEVTDDSNRKLTEAQYARELGERAIGVEESRRGTVRATILTVVGTVWVLAFLLVPIGYLGMLRTFASEATDRSELYRTLDVKLNQI